MLRIRSTLVLLSFAVSFLAADMAAAEPPPDLYTLDIAQQPLADALEDFAEQSGLQVVYFAAVAERETTEGVKGELSADAAMQHLLAGSGLTHRHVDHRTIAVEARSGAEGQALGKQRPASAAANWQASAPAGNGRTASGTSGAAVERSGPASLEEIVVTARHRFLDEDTSGTTNLPLPIEEVPQSISLISNEFLNVADLTTLADVAQYSPGALFSGNPFGFGSNVKLRGFAAGLAVDGLTVSGAAAYDPDFAIVERMEIVKGPSSVVYGTASPGGLINVVTKRGAADTPDYLEFSAGMWNRYRVEGQYARPLGASRDTYLIGVAAAERADTFMDHASRERTVLYGGVDTQLAPTVSASLHGGYERHARTSFDGIPVFADGTPAPLPRSFFIGSPAFELDTDRVHFEGSIDWDVTDTWQISLNGNYADRRSKGPVPYAFGLQENGDLSLALSRRVTNDTSSRTFGLSSVYGLEPLGLDGSFVSVSALHQTGVSEFQIQSATFDGSPTATGNIYDGVDAIVDIFESATFSDQLIYDAENEATLLSLSAQAVLRLADPLTVLLGMSSSSTDNTNEIFSIGTTEAFEVDNQKSYRAGATYEFVDGLFGYLSYSESFQPQEQVDVDYNTLPPLIGEQVEAGFKYAPAERRLLLTGAVFEIVQSNKPEYDQFLDGRDRFKAIGEVKHRGVELEVTGQVSERLELHASYAYLDAEVSASDDADAIGRKVTYLPEQTANAFATFAITDRLSANAGARYVGAARTSTDGSTADLPGYTIADLTLSYLLDRWEFQLSAHNLFDEEYYVNTYETLFYGNVIGAPANVSLSARYVY